MEEKNSQVSRKPHFADCSKSLIKRILLLLAYSVGTLCVSMYLGNGSNGTLIPFAVLSSWAVVTFLQIFPRDSPSLLGFFVLLCIYLACLLGLSKVLGRLGRATLGLVPAMIHAAGIIVALSMLPGKDKYSFDLGWMVSLPMVVGYFVMDWRLARGLPAWSKADD